MIGFSTEVVDALKARMWGFADAFERLAVTPEQRNLAREFAEVVQDMEVMSVAAALSPPARKYWEEIFKDKGVRDEPEGRFRGSAGARDL